MANEIERLTVVLEANIKKYEKEMARTRQVTDRAMRQVEQSAQGSMKRLDGIIGGAGARLKAGFAGLMAGLSVREVAELADSYTKVQNALKVAGLEGEKLRGTYEAIYAISQRQAAPLEAMATLYGRVSAAQKDLNATGAEILQVTEGVAMALKVQGTSAGEASGALLQLGQALSGGKVQAEEYNSLLDGARPVLQAVAAGMVEAGGSVSKLTALVKDGKVSSEAFFRAFLAGMPEIERQSASAGTTMSQSMSKSWDALANLVGKIDEAVQASNKASGGVNSFVATIDGIANAIPGAMSALDRLQSRMTDIGNSSVFRKIYEGLEAAGLGGMNGVESLNRFDQVFGAKTTAGSMAGYKPSGASATPITPIRNSDYAVPDDGKAKAARAERLNDYQREIQAIGERTRALEVERTTVGMSAADTAKAEAAFRLLEAAKQANIAITPQLEADIQRMAEAYGNATAEIEEARDAQEAVAEAMRDFQSTAKDAVGSFISDLRRGETAADAFSNTLDRLADKMIDMTLNSVFESKGGSGGLGNIVKLFGSLFQPLGPDLATGGMVRGPGSGTSDSITARLSNGEFVVNAKATSQYRDLLERINSGQMPRFASGGYVGAGSMSTRAGGGNFVVNITNNADAQVSQKSTKTAGGMQLDVMIDQISAQKMSTPGSASNRAVRTFGNGNPITRRG